MELPWPSPFFFLVFSYLFIGCLYFNNFHVHSFVIFVLIKLGIFWRFFKNLINLTVFYLRHSGLVVVQFQYSQIVFGTFRDLWGSNLGNFFKKWCEFTDKFALTFRACQRHLSIKSSNIRKRGKFKFEKVKIFSKNTDINDAKVNRNHFIYFYFHRTQNYILQHFV